MNTTQYVVTIKHSPNAKVISGEDMQEFLDGYLKIYHKENSVHVHLLK